MTYRSRWQEMPLDILYEQILSLEDPEDIENFCYDPYINEEICSDPNGRIWKLLYRKNLSDFLILNPGETLKSRYMKVMREIKFIRNSETLSSDLIYGAKNGYEKMVKAFPLNILPPSVLSYALIVAAENGHFSIVQYLVEKGVDFHAEHENALRIAAGDGYLDIVKYLVKNGANIHAKGEEALINAAYHGHLNIVKYLVEKGAQLHVNNEIELIWAAEHGHLEIVQYLLDKGADIQIALDNADVYHLRNATKVLSNIRDSS